MYRNDNISICKIWVFSCRVTNVQSLYSFVLSTFSFIGTTSTCPGQSSSRDSLSSQSKLMWILLCLVWTWTSSHSSLSWRQWTDVRPTSCATCSLCLPTADSRMLRGKQVSLLQKYFRGEIKPQKRFIILGEHVIQILTGQIDVPTFSRIALLKRHADSHFARNQ